MEPTTVTGTHYVEIDTEAGIAADFKFEAPSTDPILFFGEVGLEVVEHHVNKSGEPYDVVHLAVRPIARYEKAEDGSGERLVPYSLGGKTGMWHTTPPKRFTKSGGISGSSALFHVHSGLASVFTDVPMFYSNRLVGRMAWFSRETLSLGDKKNPIEFSGALIAKREATPEEMAIIESLSTFARPAEIEPTNVVGNSQPSASEPAAPFDPTPDQVTALLQLYDDCDKGKAVFRAMRSTDPTVSELRGAIHGGVALEYLTTEGLVVADDNGVFHATMHYAGASTPDVTDAELAAAGDPS